MIWDLENKFVSILEYDKEWEEKNSERQNTRLAKVTESRSQKRNNKILCKQKNRWQIAPGCLQRILFLPNMQGRDFSSSLWCVF